METWELPGEDESIPEDERIGEITLFSEGPSFEDVQTRLVGSGHADQLLSTDAFSELVSGVGAGDREEPVLERDAVDSERRFYGRGPATYTPIAVEASEEGLITIGEPRIGKLPDLWYDDRDYYLVLQPFTLEEPKGFIKRYSRLDYETTFVTDGVRAYDMYPQSVVEEETIEPEVTISPSLNFLGAGQLPLEVTFKIPFTYLKPIVVAKGRGTSAPRWTFREECATHGNKGIALVLQVPEDCETIYGILNCRATLGSVFNLKSDPMGFEFDLSGVPELPIRTSP